MTQMTDAEATHSAIDAAAECAADCGTEAGFETCDPVSPNGCVGNCRDFDDLLADWSSQCDDNSTYFVGTGCGYDVLGYTVGPGSTTVIFFSEAGPPVGTYYIGDAGDNTCEGIVPSLCHQYRVEFTEAFDVADLCPK